MKKSLALLTSIFALTGCSKADLLNFTIPKSGFTAHKNIAYGDHPRQKLNIYIPKNLTTNTPPVVLFLYGGSWQEGSKEDYLFTAQAFAQMQAVTIIPDYRIYPEVKYPAFIEDAAQAAHWLTQNLAKHYNIQPENLFVAGHSAGAFNAAALAYQPQFLAPHNLNPSALFKGFIGLAGPYAFEPNSENLKTIFSTATPAQYHPQKHPQPNPPALIMHGSSDTIVLPLNSEKMATALTQAGNQNVITYTAPKQDHVGIILSLAYRFRHRADVFTNIQNFLKTFASPAP